MIIFRKRVPGLSSASMSRFVRSVGNETGLAGTVNVLLTSSRELRSLNQRFRSKDKSTDVLSFPSVPEHRSKIAGDLAISVDIAAKNARELGHSAAKEVKILALHGMLHLAGYDHERDHGKMAKAEQRLRQAFRLPVTLIERSETARGKSQVSKPVAGKGSRRRSQVS